MKSFTKEEFKQWLVGFIDAEGNFQVFMDRKYLRVMFRINLHIDDVEILYKIKEFLGVGKVVIGKTSATYIINNTADLINVLFPILDQYKLLTTKYLDYQDFCKVVNKLIINNSSVFTGSDLTWLENCIKNMNSGRDIINYELIPNTSVTLFWLLGFIEGEGSFGFKNLVPYFQIGQNVRNTHVLTAISKFLSSLSSEFKFSELSVSLKENSTLNKSTNVLVISYHNIDSLHDILAHLLIQFPFQTRKGTDFYHWCIVLYMHKFGYIYLTEGRKLAVNIASFVNKSRYSTSINKVNTPIIDLSLFDTSLPVTLTPKMTHLELSQNFAKTYKTRNVWVYNNNVLVKGSPFMSNADAAASVGLNRTTRIVARYLDTGKSYQERYEFTTKAK